MGKKLTLVLQTKYGSNSVFWLYNRNGDRINGGRWVESDNDCWDSKLPDEIISSPEIKKLSTNIMKKYNSLFTLNEKGDKFKYIGFENRQVEDKYRAKVAELREMVYKRCGDKYEILDYLY